MAKYVIATAPAVEPVSLTTAKEHLRLTTNDDDATVQLLIQAAREIAEARLGKVLVTQTWDLYLDAFPGGDIVIAKYPLLSVTSVKYTPEGASQATVTSATYSVDIISKPGRIVLQTGYSWPSDVLIEVNGVVVRFVAGYGATAESVPAFIRQAILLLVSDLYENRESYVVGTSYYSLPTAAERLLWLERDKVF